MATGIKSGSQNYHNRESLSRGAMVDAYDYVGEFSVMDWENIQLRISSSRRHHNKDFIRELSAKQVQFFLGDESLIAGWIKVESV